jgi:hypothetical protein
LQLRPPRAYFPFELLLISEWYETRRQLIVVHVGQG